MASNGSATHDAEKNGVSKLSGAGAAQARPTFMQRYKAHMRKWWWLHLLILIAVTLIITLPLIYVGFPRIAQSGVDGASVNITNLVVTNPTPTYFHLIQDSVSMSDNMYHPYLDAFNVSLALAGSAPYAQIQLPGLTSGTSVPLHLEQDVQILDVDAYTQYNVALLNNEEIQVRVNGSLSLHEMVLPVTEVTYDKITTLKGFNKLIGFNLTSFHASFFGEPNGTNTNGTVYFPNPSVITVDLGNVTFNTYVNDTLIGNTTIENLVLKPGDNNYFMTGVSDTQLVLGLLLGTYKNGVLPVSIVGNSSIYNGKHLTYYEAALQQNVQTTAINVTAALQCPGNTTGGAGNFTMYGWAPGKPGADGRNCSLFTQP